MRRTSFRRVPHAFRKRIGYPDLRTSRAAGAEFGVEKEGGMFDIRELFQWERFVAPSMIKIFYWLVLAVVVLTGLRGVVYGLLEMAASLVGGLLAIIGALLMTLIGIVLARIAAEFVLIVFRIDDHLGEIRRQGDPR
jgi:hypothetical protein